MRILITGAGGFIGRHLRQVLPDTGAAAHGSIGRDTLQGIDLVIHAGRFRPVSEADWRIDDDLETLLIDRAAAGGTHYVMLSTRAVYGKAGAAPLRESDSPVPSSAYGRHKRLLEERALSVLGERLTILRLSNVFGFEWPGRTTFFGTMLSRLKADGRIVFDMSPGTERDFIPVEQAARIVAALVLQRAPGIFNVGAGRAMACGALASAVIDGFGGGELVIRQGEERDGFAYATSRANQATGIIVTGEMILAAARQAGRRLRDAS